MSQSFATEIETLSLPASIQIPSSTTMSQSFATEIEIPGAVCAIAEDSLDVGSIIKSVEDDRAGATVTFLGTTRNSFKGKTVTKLEYSAYSKLAIQSLANIVRNAQTNSSRSEHHAPSQETPGLIRIALHHRIGTVKIGEPSIVIAVSSPHRKEAFIASEFILEEVKRKAQIWKREYYEGEAEGDAEWKANA